MSPDQLLAHVRAVLLRELEGLDPSSLVLRLDEGAGNRSDFAVARLGDGSAMVTRVYEVDLPAGLQPIYLSPEDAALLVESLSNGAAEAGAAGLADGATGRIKHDEQATGFHLESS